MNNVLPIPNIIPFSTITLNSFPIYNPFMCVAFYLKYHSKPKKKRKINQFIYIEYIERERDV